MSDLHGETQVAGLAFACNPATGKVEATIPYLEGMSLPHARRDTSRGVCRMPHAARRTPHAACPLSHVQHVAYHLSRAVCHRQAPLSLKRACMPACMHLLVHEVPREDSDARFAKSYPLTDVSGAQDFFEQYG